MKRTGPLSLLASLASLALLTACAGDPPPEPQVPPPAEPPPVATAEPAPEPPKPPEMSPEEKKKAEQARETEEFHHKVESDAQAEQGRWTVELRAESKKLVDKSYPNIKAALQAAVAGHQRKPGADARDKDRHPVETLEFFGLKPTSVVLEYGPGEGWFTEILAPVLAKKGKLYVTMNDPAGPPDKRDTYYGLQTKLFLDKSPEVFGKVERVITDPKATPNLGLENKLDMIILTRELHGMHNNKIMKPWLAEFHKALKKKGILAIEQHRAKEGANPDETSKQGYLPEKWVISEIEAAGFKLVKKSEINANPKDTKDYAEGVWALPPSYRNKDKDREKYAAIGESDRMTLKFEKK